MSLYDGQNDTIAAVATAWGEGGIAIVRMSGANALPILKACFRPAKAGHGFKPNVLTYGKIVYEGIVLDECMAVFMEKRASYTREDVAEIQCHGGEASIRAILDALLHLGARAALPGEFTKRAFLNGRIDLAEAEAVMSVVGARGEAALRSGIRQMEGGISEFVTKISELLSDLLSGIAAATDFPEEIDEEEAIGDLLRGIDEVLAELDAHLDERRAKVVREGASIVLSGRPNVGKSSLMNALLRRERAIVTDIAGTTRDVLTERIRLGGIWAELSDTAGLRETHDPIERIGVERAERAAQTADVLLYVLDASECLSHEDISAIQNASDNMLVCLNKTDAACVTTAEDVRAYNDKIAIMCISARTGDGMDELTECLRKRVGGEDMREDILTSERHIALARRAREALVRARESAAAGIPADMCYGDVEQALEYLGEITGKNVREDVIERVFASFCVGK